MKVSLKIISNKITFHLNPLDKKLLFYMKVKIATKFKQYDKINIIQKNLICKLNCLSASLLTVESEISFKKA